MEEFCKDHATLISSVARIEEKVVAIDKRINGSIDDIHDHIKTGGNWRRAILSLIGMFLIQILVLSYMWGKLCRTVEVDSGRIGILEEIHPRYGK